MRACVRSVWFALLFGVVAEAFVAVKPIKRATSTSTVMAPRPGWLRSIMLLLSALFKLRGFIKKGWFY